MADYSELKQNIASVIKSNNRREITGQILQNVLNQMVGSLGENYQLAGFAEPTTNPQQPDQTLFYIAEQAGVYTNFDNITLDDGLSFLMWKNSEWTSHTIGVATHSWVDSNYVSKAFLRQIFRVYDADGFEILPNDTTSIADNIKAMVGLWTNEYLSALGLGDDGQTGAQYLTQLGDVEIDSTTLANGQVLVYDNGLWVNGTAGGVDMSVVWAALAGNTNEQINASHLTTALTGYVTSSSLSTTLADYVTATALNTALASYASQSWVSQNYVSIAFLNRILRAYDSTDTQVQPNDTTTAIDNLKAMVGLWTEQYLSALGQGNDGGGGGYITTLGQLEDVLLTTPSVGQALVYAEVESGVYKWINGTAGVDMSSVWTALAGSTNEQIALSHLTTALSGYVTTGGLSTTLADYVTATALSTTLADYVTATSLSTTLASYATQQWVGQNYVSIAFFNRLFAAYDSSDVIINPNDTTTAVDNIKALVGLWTQQYLSALGQGSDGGVVTSLANLTDVQLNTPISNNDVLTYDSSTNKWTNKPAQGGSTVAALGDLTDVAISSLADKDLLQWDYASGKWKNVVLSTAMSAYVTTSALASELANYVTTSSLANYVTLNTAQTITATKTMTSGLVVSGRVFGTGGDEGIVIQYASNNWATISLGSHLNNTNRTSIAIKNDGVPHWSYSDGTNQYSLEYPLKTGTIALTSDIPSLSGYATQSWVSNNYVQLSSSSVQIITRTSGDTPLILKGNTGNTYLGFQDYNGNALGYYSVHDDHKPYFYYGDSYLIWSAYYQGSGSGMDADLLDGHHGSYYAIGTTREFTINGSNWTVYSPNTSNVNLDDVYVKQTNLSAQTIQSTGSDTPIYLRGNSSKTYLGFRDSGDNYLGFIALDSSEAYHYISGTSYKIWTERNLTPSNYVLKTGDTMSGNLEMYKAGEIDIKMQNTAAGSELFYVGVSSSWYVWTSAYGSYIRCLNGNVGIRVSSPLYTLHVDGDIYATGGVTSLSDIRKKDVISYELPLSVEQIAAAPTIKFLWKDKREEGEQVGTIAQYWEKVLPQVIKDKSGELSMGYGVTALIAATIDARKIVDHEQRIKALEKENMILREELNRLKCA